MLKLKIAMLGAYGVGKTSLVSAYVHAAFSEKYLTTVGVKIDKKSLAVDGRDVTLLIWDIHGEDAFQQVSMAYLRGTAGCLVVADGTRAGTLVAARELRARLRRAEGDRPCLLLLNKADLAAEWEVGEADCRALRDEGWEVLRTSARTGEGVEHAFVRLARQALAVAASGDGVAGSAP